MELKATVPVAKMPVYVDPDSELMESVKVDTLQISGILVTHSKKEMSFEFWWGGYDSKGIFHAAEKIGISHLEIKATVQCKECQKDPKTPNHDPDCESFIFHVCARDLHGNPVIDHGTAFVEKVMLQYGRLKSILRGWTCPNLELSYKGHVVYSAKAEGEK